MLRPSHSSIHRYGASCLAVGAALLITSQIDLLTERSPFLLFFAAVIFSTLYSGRNAGFTAIGLSALSAGYFIITPGEIFPNTGGAYRIASFIVLAVPVSWLIAALRQREGSLRASEERYRFLFENNPFPMWVYDLETLRFLAVNDAASFYYGYTENEFLSMTIKDIRPPDEVPALLDELEMIKVSDSKIAPIGVWKHLRKDGSIIDVEIASHGLTFEGRPARMILANDITERARAEAAVRESEARLRILNDTLERRVNERTLELESSNAALKKSRAIFENLFDSLPGLYLVMTPELEIVTASNAFLEATMTSRPNIVGRGIFEVFPDNPGDPFANGVSNLKASIERVFETASPDTMAIQKYDMRGPGGDFEERYWSPINSPVLGADKKIEYIIHRVEEVTDFVLQSSQPLSNNKNGSDARLRQMEAEIFFSAQKIQKINRQLESANRELESFSYSVSHDLRAPLRHINGFSLALLEDYAEALDDTGKDYLKQVREASQEMAQLIDDVLKLARVSRSEMKCETIDLSQVAVKIIDELQTRDGNRRVDVKIEPNINGYCDPRLIEIALSNLIGNAWKFTSRKESAEIVFGVDGAASNPAYFVHDNGAGFDMEYSEKLFGAFQRLHTINEFEGTGIGLATVQRIINRHGGRVWAEGAVNAGAKFYFTLPNRGQ